MKTKTQVIVKDYQHVSKNPTRNLDEETTNIIKATLESKIPDKTIQAIKPNESRTAELYGLPKTYKPNIPMRPIVSACGDPIDKLSWLLERMITQLLVFVQAQLTKTDDFAPGRCSAPNAPGRGVFEPPPPSNSAHGPCSDTW